MHDIWNPWHGCKKCSEGCENCYMYFLDAQRGKNGADVTIHNLLSMQSGIPDFTRKYDESGNEIKSDSQIVSLKESSL